VRQDGPAGVSLRALGQNKMKDESVQTVQDQVEFTAEVDLSDVEAKLPFFPRVKTVFETGILMIDHDGIVFNYTGANYCYWDRNTASLQLKSKISIPKDHEISSATVFDDSVYLLLAPTDADNNKDWKEGFKIGRVDLVSQHSDVAFTKVEAPNPLLFKDDEQLNKACPFYTELTRELVGDATWMLESEGWKQENSAITSVGDQLVLINIYCCCESTQVASLSYLDKDAPKLHGERLIKTKEGKAEFNWLGGMDRNQKFHAIPLAESRIGLAIGLRIYVIDTRQFIMEALIEHNQESVLGVDFLHRQFLSLPTSLDSNFFKRATCTFRGFTLTDPIPPAALSLMPTEKDTNDELLVMLGLKQAESLEENIDLVPKAQVVDKIARNLMQAFSHKPPTLPDDQLAEILLQTRDYRLDDSAIFGPALPAGHSILQRPEIRIRHPPYRVAGDLAGLPPGRGRTSDQTEPGAPVGPPAVAARLRPAQTVSRGHAHCRGTRVREARGGQGLRNQERYCHWENEKSR
jgi:hypothetical protein